MTSVSNAIGTYYAIKNMNVSISAQASLLKLSQNQMSQQMSDLLKAMPAVNPSVGRIIDIRV